MTRNFFLAALASLLAATSVLAVPAPKEMQLFLLLGQSNMSDRGRVEAQDNVASIDEAMGREMSRLMKYSANSILITMEHSPRIF
jgi:hypothetical protein